jgi:hypothetical protein
MSKAYKTILDIAIWLLFIKGLLTIPLTFFTIGQALLGGKYSPIIGIASCAAGTLAFAMASLAVYLRSRIQ